MEGATSLITRIHSSFPDAIYLTASVSSVKTTEFELVQGILHILQGNSSGLFEWDEAGHRFCVKTGIYVAHLSLTSLHDVLNQFLYAATCLRLIGIVIKRIEIAGGPFPTLRAFASAASAWLKRLQDIALNEEVKICSSDRRTVATLLGLVNSLSSLCSGAEFLLQAVHDAVPKAWLDSPHSASAAEVAVHVLDHLYKRLNEACLIHGGEEESYKMLLFLFVASLLPYIQSLESWIYEGILDDPYNELFFYENRSVSISDTDFWEKSYLLRSLTHQKVDTEVSGVAPKDLVCPLFMKEIAKQIVSAGKSLQLIRHVPMTSNLEASTGVRYEKFYGIRSPCGATSVDNIHDRHSIAGLTLVEVFFVSISGLVGHGDHVYKYFLQEDFSSMVDSLFRRNMERQRIETNGVMSASTSSSKTWVGFLNKILHERESSRNVERSMINTNQENSEASSVNESHFTKLFCPENPVITVSQKIASNRDAQKIMRLSKNYDLPPLNDEDLRAAIYNIGSARASSANQTDYAFGFQFIESQRVRSIDDVQFLESMFPFPTILPSYQEDLQISELLPAQKNSTLSSTILRWIQVTEPKGTPLPTVILQECLNVYIKKQVDYIGSHMLSKLLKDWRLMDELEVLRAIYLLGSGDLLQHFLTVIFSRLDKGESWDDDFELNLILQESITNSADAMLLNAPDSLIVSIMKPRSLDDDDNNHNMTNFVSTPRNGHEHGVGINGLDVLNFTYKVSWPLELIANSEAIRKYNQVMHFLLKVKRAKFVLDKTRRWIWKGKTAGTVRTKRHWLVEQKLLHFVDAFHQYVMDRVYHSAWREMCQGMAAASSLDEVIDVHEAYLLSIQRQCFVVPDKLWALIASRINNILGLALDFYTVQRTLHSGGSVSTIKARCEMEVDRIEKQFDDCIAFLLRVLSFKLNVGHFPHLADLVTRINYNYYYAS